MAQLTATQKVMAGPLVITDKKGNPASIDGVPTWQSSDETVLTVVPADDGLTASIVAGVTGVARVSVNADADLGEGVEPISGVTEDVTVVAGTAFIVSVPLGTPEEQ